MIDCQVSWEALKFQTSAGRVLDSNLILQNPLLESVHAVLELKETHPPMLFQWNFPVWLVQSRMQWMESKDAPWWFMCWSLYPEWWVGHGEVIDWIMRTLTSRSLISYC